MQRIIILSVCLFFTLAVINSCTAADTRIDFFLSARNLPNKDPFGGAPDAFVKVWYAGSDFDKYALVDKTKDISDNNNPNWPEMFNFYLYGEGTSSQQKIKFEIIDSDVDFDDAIGTVEIRLHSLVSTTNLNVNINPSGNGVLNIQSRINSTFARGQVIDERFNQAPTKIISLPFNQPKPELVAPLHYRNQKM